MNRTWVAALATFNYVLGLFAPAIQFIPYQSVVIAVELTELAITVGTGVVILWGGEYEVQDSTRQAYMVAYVVATMLGVHSLILSIWLQKHQESLTAEQKLAADRIAFKGIVLMYALSAMFPVVPFVLGGANLSEVDPGPLPESISYPAFWYATSCALQYFALFFMFVARPGATRDGGLLRSRKSEDFFCFWVNVFGIAGIVNYAFLVHRVRAQSGDFGEIVAHFLSVIGTESMTSAAVMVRTNMYTNPVPDGSTGAALPHRSEQGYRQVP